MKNELLENVLSINRTTVVQESSAENMFLNKISSGIASMKNGYWLGGEEETDTSLVFEFLSTSAPTIRVFVDKTELAKYFRKEDTHG